MTRTRRKSCKGGLEGLSNESWMKVAKSGKTFLTPIMIEEITDPMSIKMATTHFSEAVESMMERNGDLKAASLCRDIRQWWEAEDTPGISATERLGLREGLRQRLVTKADFGKFPPPTMYIDGWPIQLWEALIANIDAKTILYCLCYGGTYNVRAFSSMIGETFFAELTLNDKRGHGTVSCSEFGQFIGNTIEQIQIRLNPERSFSYHTSRSTCYNLVENGVALTHDHEFTCRLESPITFHLPENIILMDHGFDNKERKRIIGRKKLATVSTDRNSLQKGSVGVRWEKARIDQSKMLPTKRMGIEHTDSKNYVPSNKDCIFKS